MIHSHKVSVHGCFLRGTVHTNILRLKLRIMEASELQWGQKRTRSGGIATQPTVTQVRAVEIPREGGRFVKSRVPKSGATSGCSAPKPADQRLQEERDAIKKRLIDVIQEHKESRNAETAQ
jgi:hypothetical protein